LAASCVKQESQEVSIGAILPLTGVASDIGKDAEKGIQMATDEINAGLNGQKRLKVHFEDSQMNSTIALTAFKKMVEVDHIVAVITSGSGVVLSIAPEAERRRVVQINYAAVNPAIRFAGDYTFSLVNDSHIETEAMAKFTFNNLQVRELVILYANTSYGVGTKDAMTHNFESLGGKVVGSEAYNENIVDARPILSKIKPLRPHAIYLPGTIKDAATILRQAVEVGLKTQWLSYNAIEGPSLIQIAGNAAEGLIYTSSNLYDLPLKNNEGKRFFNEFNRKYGTTPSIYSAIAYDAVNLLMSCAEHTHGTGEEIKNELYKITDYKGASGIISFDSTGSVRMPVFIKIIKNGRFVVLSKNE
jgi:branched-chain amino acid transport system substrate-binding protein